MANPWESTTAIRAGRKRILEEEGYSATGSAFGITTSYGQEMMYPEQFVKNEPDPTYDASTLTEFDTTLPWDVLNRERNNKNIRSEADLRMLEARHETQGKMRERMSHENFAKSLALQFPFELVNPYNYPELLAAYASGGGTLAYRLAVGGLANAATAYASESAVQRNNAYDDENAKNMAGLLGFAFGSAAWGYFGRPPKDNVKHMSVEAIENALEGTTVRNLEGDISIYSKDDKGKLNLREATGDEIPPEATGIGRYAISMMGRMRKSKSGLERAHAEAFDVVGNSKGLNTKDTVTYIKELHQRNHMEGISTLNKLFEAEKKAAKSSGNKIDVEQWNREVKNQFDRMRNGHSVSPQYKSAVDAVTKWADTQKQYMTEAGYRVREDWTPRAYNESKIREFADKDLEGLYTTFTNAALSKLKKSKGKQIAASKVKTDQSLIDLKQKYAVEEEAVIAEIIKRGKKGKAEVKKMLNKHGKPYTSKHPTLKSLKGRIKYAEKRAKTLSSKGTKDDIDLETKARDTAKTFVDNMLNRDREMMDVDMLKERTYEFDESMISHLMHQDITKLMMHTSNATAGRMAAKKRFGIGNKKELEEAVAAYKEGLQKEGALSSKEINKSVIRFEKGIKSSWGTLMRADNPDSGSQLIKRFMLNTNFAAMGGGFASTALQGEAAVLLMSGSLKHALSGMGIGFREFRNTIKGQTPDSKYAHQLQIMTYAYDVNTHSTLGRFVDGDHDPTMFRGAGFADKATLVAERAAELSARYAGLTPVTASLRMALGHVILQDLFQTPMKTLMKDVNKYNRIQVDLSRVAEIRRIDKEKGVFQYNQDGSISNIDLSKLPADLQHMLERGVSNASRLNILNGDKMHLPSIYSDPNNVVMAMLLQFTSFPVQAFDSLLIRGVDEDTARMAVAVAAGAITSSVFAMGNEQMQIGLGVKKESERKFDPTTDEGMEALTWQALRKGSILAPIALFSEYPKKLLTGKGLGSDYQSRGMWGMLGPTASRMNDIALSAQSIDFNPFDEHSNAWNTVYGRTLMLNSFLPLYTLPLVGDVFRHWNKQAADNSDYMRY